MADPVLIGPLLRGYRETFGKSSLGTEYVASADLPYLVQGAADPEACRAFCLTEAPASYEDCPLTTIDIDKQVGEYDYEVTAHYALPPSTEFKEDPDKTFSFDFGTTNQNIKNARAFVASYGPKASEHVGTLIGDDGTKVKGADIPMPESRFTEQHWFTDEQMTDAFRAQLSKMVGKVNSTTFRGYAAGEVLCIGVQGSRRGDDSDDPWEITFTFAISENDTNIPVGDFTVSTKLGWHYLDIRYEQKTSTTSLVSSPVAAKVLRIFTDADLAALMTPAE